MAKSTHFIAQIQEAESDAQKSEEAAQKKNDQAVIAANEASEAKIAEAEEKYRKVAVDKIGKSKEKAKEEYKKILVDLDNERRDTVENGKTNLPKAEKQIHEALMGLFQS